MISQLYRDDDDHDQHQETTKGLIFQREKSCDMYISQLDVVVAVMTIATYRQQSAVIRRLAGKVAELGEAAGHIVLALAFLFRWATPAFPALFELFPALCRSVQITLVHLVISLIQLRLHFCYSFLLVRLHLPAMHARRSQTCSY